MYATFLTKFTVTYFGIQRLVSLNTLNLLLIYKFNNNNSTRSQIVTRRIVMGNINAGQFSSQFTQQEIQKLYARFKQIDSDGSGDLDPKEIFNVPELAQNPLVQRVISIFDLNKDGKISFNQFLTGTSPPKKISCTAVPHLFNKGLAALYGNDDEKKLKFAFKIYDMDEDGFISNRELFTVLKMMVGSNLTDVQLQQLVDRTILKADLDYDGLISFEEFKSMVKDLDVASKLTLNKI